MTKTKRIFLDLHAIQTLPPSNINRDDTGSPKTCQYGGVKRARVSSQSWKRAMRQYFYDEGLIENVGIRSKNVVQYVADKIIELDPSKSEEALKMAEGVFNDAKIKTKDGKTTALFFLGEKQADKLAQASLEGNKDKNYLQSLFNDQPAIDIALFGRMVADDPSLNEDASSQVAHSISTHAVDTEFDFFTAVDDLAPEDNAGAGMLGTIEFNSSTLYRYANVAIHQLNKQLSGDESIIDTISLYIKSFANSLPTGKVNTFANQTIPQFVLISLRDDRPVNLVSAFEDPIRSSHGFVEKSSLALIEEYQKAQKIVNKPIKSYLLDLNNIELENFDGERYQSLVDMISDLSNDLNQYLSDM